MKCGNNFFVGVIRPDENGASEPLPEDISQMENGLTNENGYLDPLQNARTPDSQAYSEMSEVSLKTNQSEPLNNGSAAAENPEITDEHIAEMMSGEAEVLKEHNVIGYLGRLLKYFYM